MVKYMLLLGRSVKDNIPLLRGQLVERHVSAHSHRPADIGHQGPHQSIPRQHRTLVDAQGLVRHQGGLIHGADSPGAVAGRAGPAAVEGQFLCGRSVEMRPALRAD